MSVDSSFALQAAIVTALKASSDVTDLVGARIYDDPPRGTEFPYVSIGQATSAPWDTATETGFEHTLHLHVWSRQGGRKEAKAVLAAMYDALHGATLTLDGHRLIMIRFEFAESFRDEDGETMHGIARYRAFTEPS